MAGRITLGDIFLRLGIEGEEEFYKALEEGFHRAVKRAEEEGGKAGMEYMSAFAAAVGGGIGAFLGVTFSDATIAIHDFVAESIDAFRYYEIGLSQLAGNTSASLDELDAKLSRIAEDTRVFSKREVTDAVLRLVKAGFRLNEAMELVHKGAALAAGDVDVLTGRFGDLGEMAEITGQVMRAMRRSLEDAGHVTDVLAQAAQDSSTDVRGLADAIAVVGPVADQAEIPLETLAAMVTVLTNQGHEAATAARGLRSMIQSLIKPPATVRQEFERLGITLITSEGRFRSIHEVLRNLNRVVRQGPQGLRLLARGMDTFALSMVTALARSSGEVEELSKKFEQAQGAAERFASLGTDNLNGSLKELQARIEDLKTVLGQELGPALTDLINDVLIPFVRWLGQSRREFEDWLTYVVFRAPRPTTFAEDLAKAQEELRRKLAEYRRLQLDIQATVERAPDYGVPSGLAKYAEQLGQDIERLKRRIQALKRLVEQEQKLKEGLKREPVTPEKPVEGGGGGKPPAPPAHAERALSLAEKAGHYLSILDAKLRLGLIGQRRYVEELSGLYARLAEARRKAVEAGKTAEANELLLALSRIQTAIDRVNQEAERKRRELERWRQELTRFIYDEFAGLDHARRIAAIRPAEGPPHDERLVQGAATTARVAEALKEKLTALNRVYELGQVDTGEYREKLRDLLDAMETLLSVVPRGSEAWNTLASAVVRARGELERAEAQLKAMRLDEFIYDEFAGYGRALRLGLIGPAERAVEVDRRLTEGAVTTARALSIVAAELRRLNGEFSAGVIDQSTYRSQLQELLANLEALLGLLPRTSDEYVRLLDLITRVRQALKGLGLDTTGPEVRLPELQNLWPEGGEFAGMDKGIRASLDYTQQAVDELARELENTAIRWGSWLVEGLRKGDVGGALERILLDASNIFTNTLLQAILGPIAESLAKAAISALGGSAGGGLASAAMGALGPWGLLLGLGLAFLPALLGGGGGGAPQAGAGAAHSLRSTPSQITYHAETHLAVNLEGAIDDPETLARIRSLAEDVTLSTLRRLGLIKEGA